MKLTRHIATSVTTHMGLMPELDRVWISIDHNLFLWDYVEGYDQVISTCIQDIEQPPAKN